MTPLIYIAGPFTSPTAEGRMANVDAAHATALLVYRAGAFPVVPHSLGLFMHGRMSEKDAISGTKELLARCDAVYLAPGWETSKGTLGELDLALARGLAVMTELEELEEWLSDPDCKPLWDRGQGSPLAG